MATKRPDQLPSGNNFDFDDLLMVEKNPNQIDRELLKTSISDFMDSALKFDPERFGENPITGFQSQFKWLMETVQTLTELPSLKDEVDSYEEVQRQDPVEKQFLPTPTPSITPTSSRTQPPPASPLPSLTPTPTPSRPSFIANQSITFSVTNAAEEAFITKTIPNQYMPEFIGDYKFGGGVLRATGWEFVSNEAYYSGNFYEYEDANYASSPFIDDQNEDGVPPEYEAYPDNFTPSSLQEKLYKFKKPAGDYGREKSDLVYITTSAPSQGVYSIVETAMFQTSSITFTIKYLY